MILRLLCKICNYYYVRTYVSRYRDFWFFWVWNTSSKRGMKVV